MKSKNGTCVWGYVTKLAFLRLGLARSTCYILPFTCVTFLFSVIRDDYTVHHIPLYGRSLRRNETILQTVVNSNSRKVNLKDIDPEIYVLHINAEINIVLLMSF